MNAYRTRKASMCLVDERNSKSTRDARTVDFRAVVACIRYDITINSRVPNPRLRTIFDLKRPTFRNGIHVKKRVGENYALVFPFKCANHMVPIFINCNFCSIVRLQILPPSTNAICQLSIMVDRPSIGNCQILLLYVGNDAKRWRWGRSGLFRDVIVM